VRFQQEISVTGDRASAVVAALRRSVVTMQTVGQFLIHVYHHRILLAGLVSRGIIQRALQTNSGRRLVLDQLRAAPGVIPLEWVSVGGLLGVLQIGASDKFVGRVVEGFRDVGVNIGVFGFGQPLDTLVG